MDLTLLLQRLLFVLTFKSSLLDHISQKQTLNFILASYRSSCKKSRLSKMYRYAICDK